MLWGFLATAFAWSGGTQKHFLNIRMPSQNGVDFRVDFHQQMSGIDAAAAAARHLNVHPAFVVLWKNQAGLSGSPNGAQTLSDRDALLRVDNSALRLGGAEHRVRAGDTLTLALRPLRGDHFHNAVAIYYKGRLLDVPTDRPVLAVGNNLREGEDVAQCGPDLPGGQAPTHAAPGAGQPPGFHPAAAPPEAGDQTYIGERPWEGNHVNTVYPHFGVHSGHDRWFGMGLIHVHPATSWQWYRGSEGLGATLGAFLEQVGIWAWETESNRYPQHTPTQKARAGVVVLDFPPGTKLAGEAAAAAAAAAASEQLESNYPDGATKKPGWSHCDYPTRRVIVQNDATHEWRLYYWPHVDSPAREAQTFTSRFDRLWLHHNQAMVVLAFEERAYAGPARRPSARSVAYLRGDAGAFKAQWKQLYPGDDAKAHSSIPHDVSAPQVLGFDGAHYPMPNLAGSAAGAGAGAKKPWAATPPKNEAAVLRAALAAQQKAAGREGAPAWGGAGGGSSSSSSSSSSSASASDESAAHAVPVSAALGMAGGVGLLASALTFLFTQSRRRPGAAPRAYTRVSADQQQEDDSGAYHSN